MTNSDYLTRGRQTLCPITNQSVPASVAYTRMLKVYRDNLHRQTFTMEWLTGFNELMTLDRFVYETTVKEEVVKKVKKKGCPTEHNVGRMKVITKNTTVIGSENVRKVATDWARSFASYIKHKERGRMATRAIASPNMILRRHLAIIERFHLRLSKRLTGH